MLLYVSNGRGRPEPRVSYHTTSNVDAKDGSRLGYISQMSSTWLLIGPGMAINGLPLPALA